MRECRWTQFKKENCLEMELFWLTSELEKDRPMLRLFPRATVRGGAIETYQLKFSIEENPEYRLFNVDINSLYSRIALDNSFGVGYYEIIIDKKDLNQNIVWNETKKEFTYKNESMASDVAHVTWLAPSNLKRPFLPFRVNDEFNYLSLCRKCVLKKISKTCPHRSDKVRSFTSSYCLTELNFAKTLGYTIISFHEVHHYQNQSPYLAEYVKILSSQKLKYSNILKGLSEEEKQPFCDHLNKSMNLTYPYELRVETICDNSHQKQFYKDMMNNFFGKFAQKANYNTFHFCKTLSEIESFINKPNSELVDLTEISENICQIELSNLQKSKPNLNGCLYVTAKINALAREYLYNQISEIEKVNGIILSCDTDSVIFALKKTIKNPLKISPEIGAFKNVLEGCELLSFYSLNPRNYSIMYKNSNNEINHLLKVKGLSLQSQNCNELITHEMYSKFVEQNFKDTVETFYVPQMRKQFKKSSKTYQEVLSGFTFSSECHVKRYLSKDSTDFETFPYGFKKK